MSATQDLDQLLDELRRTSLDYSTGGGRQLVNGHTPRQNARQIYNPAESTSISGPGRYSTRSFSFTGPRSAGANSGSKWTSYQRSQAFSSERTQMAGRSPYERTNSYGQTIMSQGDGLGVTGTTSNYYRHATPAPLTPGTQRYQTTYRTTLNHRPPLSPKRFNQVNVTIDPEVGQSSTSMMQDNHIYLSPSTTRHHMNSITTNAADTSDGISYREQRLLEELSSARQELAMLKRASSVIDEPIQRPPAPPSTLPTQRRAFAENRQQQMYSNRHHTQYQSHHDIQHGSSLFRSPNSGFSSGMPKRAMSSANVMNSNTWNFRNGMTSGPVSPTPGYSTVRSISGVRSGSIGPQGSGYSARRERMKQEAEHALRQSTQRMNQVAASSNDLRSSSIHQQRRQHYHSMSTIQPERTGFEEVETVTLQPIGRGVQDLDSNMGSTATLSKPRRHVASSMMEGLNRMDNYGTSRQQMSSFGRQTSAMDISQPVAVRPQRATSNSFLSSLRRQSTGVVSDNYQNVAQSSNAASSAHQQQHYAVQHQQPLYSARLANTGAAGRAATTTATSQHYRQQEHITTSYHMQQHQQQHQMSSSSQHQQQHQAVASSSGAGGSLISGQGSLGGTGVPPVMGGLPSVGGMAASPDLAHVEATSPMWYRLKLSRQDAISMLKNQPAGSFLVRDSTTFKDAYGLAVKSTKPPNKANQKSGFAKFMKNILTDGILIGPHHSSKQSDDINSDLVRHYLIETVTTPQRGVRIKGFSAEPVFPDLLALIHHHTQFPVALPCCLVLPPLAQGQVGVGMGANGMGANDSMMMTGVDTDSVNMAQTSSVTNNGNSAGIRSMDQTPVSFQSVNGGSITAASLQPQQQQQPRNITSPLSPTAGMFQSEIASPPPNISCRCLYLGAVEVDASLEEGGLLHAVDTLVPGPMLQATACDQLGPDSPVQYTECQLQAAHNEGILLTDLSRKLFFQRHFSANSFIYAGVDPRDKSFIHPNHSALGLDKPRLFGFIIKKLSGEYMGHVFSEFDANNSASGVVAQINSLLLNK